MLCGADADPTRDADPVDTGAAGRDDADGLAQLVERQGDRVYRLAMLLTGAGADAEAIVREALEAAATTQHASAEEPALEAWIIRAAVQAVTRTLRERRPGAKDLTGDDGATDAAPAGGVARSEPSIDDWTKRVDERAVRHELPGLTAEAIGALPAAERIALVLHDVEGLSREDIAATLGMDLPAVSSRVHRGRLLLRARLSRHLALPRDSRG